MIMIIAIDGPSSSGKGTISRLLGQKLGFSVLDTGLLYRLFAYRTLEQKIDPNNELAVSSFLNHFQLNLSDLTIPFLKENTIAQAASIVSQYPAVRENFLEFQRNFAKNPSFPHKGAILDGRDIGTVIVPNADLKLFITADVTVRAQRRWKELQERGIMCMFDDILSDLKARDERDIHRSQAPLKAAPDAHIIDTSTLSPQDVVDKVMNFVKQIHP